ncbi:LytR/AlgR family response regulator transcription factor [Clostridium estertheticum]|uniref:LytR/AlgR family response regulator transcription factor n=1 Tax=Clostridium estertheticum TaxID=238834 RepID=UPI001CF26A77|nr:LytTR family DNA-binding domain-containing protein [Clostridium estertheticum]MCB2338843.1 LytTR family DNA-binding domain-containing protein [Clostridium estertheticum]
MLKIAVCEDDQNQRQDLVKMLERNLNKEQYDISEFSSGEELLLSIKKFDMYFLDIQMNGLTGIEVAKKIRSINEISVIIFITGFKGYVFEAFDVRAFHYILKPVQEEKFKEILRSALTQFEKNDKFIITRIMGNLNKIFIKDILYIESEQRKLKVHTSCNIIEYYYKISDMEHELQGCNFFRCHKSYIVNLKYVQSFDSGSITLRNCEKIYLSKYKSADFSRKFMYYLKNEEQ